jgi:MOSC domain-containing protein YiiM
MARDASGLNVGSSVARLLNAPVRAGVVTWIGLRPERRQPLVAVPCAELNPEDGLVGDHYRGRGDKARQVTLIQAEHVGAIAAYLGGGSIEPDLLRRNIVVSGINLHALKGRRFRVGSVLLLATGECHPCSRMEEILGPGGYNAVRGHGGITARVVEAGRVCVGDPVARDDDPDSTLR